MPQKQPNCTLSIIIVVFTLVTSRIKKLFMGPHFDDRILNEIDFFEMLTMV